MAALLPELFPTAVRYSWVSNLAAIVGTSTATIVALNLNELFGLTGIAIHLVGNGILSLWHYVAYMKPKILI